MGIQNSLFAQSVKVTEVVGTKVGAGVSSYTSGRPIPALQLGRQFTPSFYTGMSMVGVQSKAYYTNSYNAVVLFWPKNAPFWGGVLHSSLGFGAYYNEKGIKKNIESDPDSDEIEKDRDYMLGPAFSIEWRIGTATKTYLGFEYTMGIGTGAFGLGFGDIGVFTVGAFFP